MNEDDRFALRDDISAIIRAHPCWLGMVPTVTYDVSMTLADEIMARLFGGAYTITTAGRDYLADHRRALRGGWDCDQDGHALQLGDANGQEPDKYVNCAHCGLVSERDAFRR